MRIAMTLLTLALAVGAGCKKKTDTATEGSGSAAMAGSGSAAMAGSGSAMAGSDMGSGSAMAGSAAGSGSAMAGSGSGAGAGSAETLMAHHAGMCPSTVFGSTTKAEIKGKDVHVTITSDDKDAIAAVQKRSDELLAAHKDKKAPGAEHDQKGDHGGSMGLCPVYLPDGATAKAKHEKNGVVVTITPKDKPDALKTEIDARIQKSADWVKANIKPGDKGNQGGVGGGKADEGMNRSGSGDAKGMQRKKDGNGSGGGKGTGGGGGKGGGGGTGSGAKK
jgi:hypothetical protein